MTEIVPYNKKLHKYLIEKGYKWTHSYRWDKYSLGGRTIYYYVNSFIVILDGNLVAHGSIYDEIRGHI